MASLVIGLRQRLPTFLVELVWRPPANVTVSIDVFTGIGPYLLPLCYDVLCALRSRDIYGVVAP